MRNTISEIKKIYMQGEITVDWTLQKERKEVNVKI